MATIKPTVDSVGDAALTDSIIDKSITELQDNVVTRLRDSALSGCAALKKAVFGALTGSQGSSVFSNCTALARVDFRQNVDIGAYSFSNCTALKALILRSATLCENSSTTALEGSGIANGTGYIYVPSALLGLYTAKASWSTYWDQFRAIEDYPEVDDPYSWSIVEKAIKDGTYKDIYAIGDTVPLDLGSEGVINMQIAAFDTDTLADGSGTAAISWVAKELLSGETKWFSASNPGGSYEDSDLRTYVRGTVKSMISTDVFKQIVAVKKQHEASSSSTETPATLETAEDVWVPSFAEVGGGVGIYKSLFPTSGSVVKKDQTGRVGAWWLRDKSGPNGSYITSGGSKATSYSFAHTFRVCLCFCTGRTPT